jgi:hypothetical protein
MILGQTETNHDKHRRFRPKRTQRHTTDTTDKTDTRGRRPFSCVSSWSVVVSLVSSVLESCAVNGCEFMHFYAPQGGFLFIGDTP